MGNAIKFTKNGTITLVTDGSEKTPEQLHLRFTVHDTGPGIPHERQEKIFESFTQADNSHTRTYGGAGLGLTISKHLATSIGGTLTLKSEPGKGSTFTFSADFKRSETCKLDEDMDLHTAIDAEALSNLKILLVEDDAINQQIAAGLLEASGAIVTVADNGPKALDILTGFKPDVILMDIQMPGMDGYETTREIRSIRGLENIPVIAMTAHAFSDAKEKASHMKMNDFITKPINPHRLISTLLKWRPPESPISQLTPSGPTPQIGKPGNAADETRLALQAVTNSLSRAAAQQLFSATANALPRRIRQLIACINNQEWKEAAQHAHQIKGMMFIFGNTRIKDLLRSIEKYQENNIDPDIIIPRLQAETDQALELIGNELREMTAMEEHNASQSAKPDYWQQTTKPAHSTTG